MEPTISRFYCYGNVYISTGKDQGKSNQTPNYEFNRGHCESCDWTFSTPTSGLSDGKQWLLCAECRLGLELASGQGSYKTKLCYWFKNKEGCPAGEACTFMHGANDKGTNKTPLVQATPYVQVPGEPSGSTPESNGVVNTKPVAIISTKNHGPLANEPEQETPKYKAIYGSAMELSSSPTEPQ